MAELSKEMTVELTYKTEASMFSKAKMGCYRIKLPCEYTFKEPKDSDVAAGFAGVGEFNVAAGDVLSVQEGKTTKKTPAKHVNRRSFECLEKSIRHHADLHDLVPSIEIRYLVPGADTEAIDAAIAYQVPCLKVHRPAGETAYAIMTCLILLIKYVKNRSEIGFVSNELTKLNVLPLHLGKNAQLIPCCPVNNLFYRNSSPVQVTSYEIWLREQFGRCDKKAFGPRENVVCRIALCKYCTGNFRGEILPDLQE